jgi:hypothetical protein
MTAIQPTVPDGPLFWTIVRGFTHVGRYRRHYAIVALWAVAMLLLPTWSGDLIDTTTAAPLPVRRVPLVPENATAAAVPISPIASSPSFAASGGFASTDPSALDFGQDEDGPAFGGGGGAGRPGGVTFTPPPPSDDGGDTGEDEGGDETASPITIPPPPPVPIPMAPKEIQPLLRALSPLVRTGCSAVGLAGVVIAVAGPGLEPVPATQLAPYLVPAYAACATFPPFGARTVCALDDLYAVDTGGLIPSPAVIGMGIDSIEQMEKLGELAGGPPPGTAEQLRQQLDCRKD